MINVLVVEDSPVARDLLVYVLDADPALHVMATAADGAEALALVARRKPDIITMDIYMPRMDGFETTRRIMETTPVPIVMVTAGLQPQDVATSFRAMEAGAVAALEKPVGIGHPRHREMADQLRQTVKLMSEVKVIKRWGKVPSSPAQVAAQVAAPGAPPATRNSQPATRSFEVVAVGASTGGPPVLQTLLLNLPRDFAAPVLIVQHIAGGFLPGLVDWLAQTTAWPVHIAAQRERPLPGHAYLAPDNYHLGLTSGGLLSLSEAAPENGLRPAVSYLFRSVALTYGARAAGVLLTGMGRDGAEELKLLKERGAITIAQDQASSIVHGMPGAAIKLDAATYVLPPPRIAAMLAALVQGKTT